MRDFTDELAARLHTAAEAEGNRGVAARSARTIAAAPKPLGGALAVLAAGVAAVVLAAGSVSQPETALAFPILAKQPVDASAHRSKLKVLTSAGIDLRAVRSFETPRGQGYAGEAGGKLCVAVPDASSIAGSCLPIGVAKAQGLIVTLVGGTVSQGGSEYVAVLPDGTAPPIAIYEDGTTEPLPVVDGVVAASFPLDVKVRTTIAGRERTIDLPLIVPGDGPNTTYFCHGHPATGATRTEACGSGR